MPRFNWRHAEDVNSVGADPNLLRAPLSVFIQKYLIKILSNIVTIMKGLDIAGRRNAVTHELVCRIAEKMSIEVPESNRVGEATPPPSILETDANMLIRLGLARRVLDVYIKMGKDGRTIANHATLDRLAPNVHELFLMCRRTGVYGREGLGAEYAMLLRDLNLFLGENAVTWKHVQEPKRMNRTH